MFGGTNLIHQVEHYLKIFFAFVEAAGYRRHVLAFLKWRW
jgi:hypothetical protein